MTFETIVFSMIVRAKCGVGILHRSRCLTQMLVVMKIEDHENDTEICFKLNCWGEILPGLFSII